MLSLSGPCLTAAFWINCRLYVICHNMTQSVSKAVSAIIYILRKLLTFCHGPGSSSQRFELVLSVVDLRFYLLDFRDDLSSFSVLFCSEFSISWCFWVLFSIFLVTGFLLMKLLFLCPSLVFVLFPEQPLCLLYLFCLCFLPFVFQIHKSFSRSVLVDSCFIWQHLVPSFLYLVLLPVSNYLWAVSAPPTFCLFPHYTLFI